MENMCSDNKPSFGKSMRPGYAYVPVQRLEKVYSPCKAMKVGTIFPELNITMEEYERGLYDGK